MDMARKFIQMGIIRARRYAHHKGGRKYGKDGNVLEKWEGEDIAGKRAEKEEASTIFRGYWELCRSYEGYKRSKAVWIKEKREWEKEKKRKGERNEKR